MVTLQYQNGPEWIDCGQFHSEAIAWMSLGGDDFGYRTIDADGLCLTDKT